jgi:hypothetical protein
MYDGAKIIAGLVIGVGLLMAPFFYNAGKAAKAPEPELTVKAKEAGECVAPKDYMTEYHMQLLDDWRNTAVRDGERYYDTREKTLHLQVLEDISDASASAGERHYNPVKQKVYYKSLQVTCLDCHSNKSKFCDQCHNYIGVTPYCWECHLQPEENK